MNNKRLSLISGALSVLAVSAMVMPASAAMLGSRLGLNATTSATVSLDTAAKTRADAQIQARIAALNELQVRIGQMVKVSSDEKANLNSNIQASIGTMTNLQAKIDADTDNTTLRTDVQSITKSYRIYVLIMPQGRITAAADRVMTIVGLFGDLSAKLQTRITAAQTAGQNVTALNASLADMNSKTGDANVQAQAAIAEIAGLQPDNGDKTIFTSNQAALKDARSKIKLAMTDLKTARQDAGNIVKALISMKVTASATTTAQ
ncbi:MAG: hypothetical protein P4L74_06680 [Candidatus Doudnabacteria bacterium]|nr:hypothetical protein [Candidatus Doudnabacteria bacterium]